MPLTGKYLKYTPEITLEIFTLVWNKLIDCGWKSYSNQRLQDVWIYLTEHSWNGIRHESRNKFIQYKNDSLKNLTETTVQEILGYDPFVKDDFALPKSWYVVVNEENLDILSKWRFNNSENKLRTGQVVGISKRNNQKGHNSTVGEYFDTEITFEQFKKYVLKENIEETKEKDWSKASEKELLEEAKRRYPIGTRFNSTGGNTNCTIPQNYYLSIDHVGDVKIMDGIYSIGYLYSKFRNEWAEIISLPEAVIENKEIIPEYVECIQKDAYITEGIIYKVQSEKGYSYNAGGDVYYINDRPYFQTNFKPSTKEAFDAQNKPKPIEKWSIGSYVVFCKKCSHNQKVGQVDLIVKPLNNDEYVNCEKYGSLNITRENNSEIKWFATKSEAEEFAKTLIEPVKETKQPLKQAVHCKTQEEWDFVTEKLGNDGENWFKHADWGNNKSFCISFEGKNQSQTLDFYQKGNYQILSFQEWCDLNGYKMEKEVEFRVGDIVMINESELPITGNWLGEGDRINKQGVFTITNIADGYIRSLDNIKCCLNKYRFRHATPGEINNHLIMIGQIPTGEPLNTGIEPNKDGMFKYTIVGGNSFNSECSTSITRTVEIIKPATIEFNYLPEPK